MINYPDTCITESSHLAFCLRWQEIAHEKCVTGDITEADRARIVWLILPQLVQEQANCAEGNYSPGNPPWNASAEDWNGSDFAVPGGLNPNNKGAVYSHALRVCALNNFPDAASIKAGGYRTDVLKDTYWDAEINAIMAGV